MRQVIKDTFFDFTAKREGFTPFMYCDTLNLVTTGVGNLIDAGARNGFDTSPTAMAPALGLQWFTKGDGWTVKNPVTGSPLSQQAVINAWIATKLQEQSQPGFNKKGGFAYQNLTNATLSMDGLKALFLKTMLSFDAVLQKRYPTYQAAPSDAQNAMMSMAWAMGPAFNFPAFKAAVDANDWEKAGQLSFFNGGGGSLNNRSGRNAENVIMFNNAAEVQRAGGDFDRLFFPNGVTSGGGVGPNSTPSGGGAAGAGAIAKIPAPSLKTTGLVIGGTAAAGFAGWGIFELGKRKRWW